MSSFFGLLIIAGLYFIPSIVAYGRKNHTGAIFALNLFLGWTLLGWVVALVMALWSNNSGPTKRDTKRQIDGYKAAQRAGEDRWWEHPHGAGQ
jgi:hypothetical protein